MTMQLPTNLVRFPADERPWFMLSPEDAQEIERIRGGQYFLVRTAGNGEIQRCTRCRGKHRYLTLMCLERPFSGLTGGLFGYYMASGSDEFRTFLSPAERLRLDQIQRLLQIEEPLGERHPEMVRQLHTVEQDADLGAVALGVLEPVDRRVAQRLQSAINLRGINPPLALPGLEV